MTVKMNNLAAMEINMIRPFFAGTLDRHVKLHKVSILGSFLFCLAAAQRSFVFCLQHLIIFCLFLQMVEPPAPRGPRPPLTEVNAPARQLRTKQ